MTRNNAYISKAAAAATGECQRKYPSTGQFDYRCGGALENFQFPLQGPKPTPNFPKTVMVTGSTTGIGPGGMAGAAVSRAVLRVDSSRAVRVFDQIGYVDPNVPCSKDPSHGVVYRPIVNWELIRFTGGGDQSQFGWVPRRAGDGLAPNPMSPGQPRTC